MPEYNFDDHIKLIGSLEAQAGGIGLTLPALKTAVQSMNELIEKQQQQINALATQFEAVSADRERLVGELAKKTAEE